MEKLSLEQAKVEAIRVGSERRFEKIMALYQRMDVNDWFELLGYEWSGCDYFYPDADRLERIMGEASREQLDLMMTDDELKIQRSIEPGTIIYRGCYPFNIHGLSWTLDREVAERLIFSYKFYHEARKPRLAIAEVLDPSTLVYKNDRKELEVVVSRFSGIRINKLAFAKKRDLPFSSELVH